MNIYKLQLSSPISSVGELDSLAHQVQVQVFTLSFRPSSSLHSVVLIVLKSILE